MDSSRQPTSGAALFNRDDPRVGAEAACTAADLHLFIRDDDIGPLTDELRAFVRMFKERRLPVSYQIIPERLTRECAAFLIEQADADPSLMEFGQHGLRHEMLLRGKRLKREFGPERSLDEQTADILAGRARLAELLGDGRDVEVFTPPQHKYDRSTLLAAAAAGHSVFSAACYPTPHHRLAYAVGSRLGLASIRHHGFSRHGEPRPEAPLLELSIAVAVDNGRRLVTGADALPSAMQAAGRRSGIVGLMLHHAIYDTAERRRELTRIADYLADLGPDRFATLGEVAARVRSGERAAS